MSAKKGIKAKIVAWLEANPAAQVTGREIEQMYVDHGGAVNGSNYPRTRRGRVAQDTMERLVSNLPIRKVANGLGGRGGGYGQGIERATYVFDPTSKSYRPTAKPPATTNADGSWIDSP